MKKHVFVYAFSYRRFSFLTITASNVLSADLQGKMSTVLYYVMTCTQGTYAITRGSVAGSPSLRIRL